MSTWRKSALYRRLEAIPDMTERVKTYITHVVNYYTEDPKRRAEVCGYCSLRTSDGRKCAIGLLHAATRLEEPYVITRPRPPAFDDVLPEAVKSEFGNGTTSDTPLQDLDCPSFAGTPTPVARSIPSSLRL